ncbi:hypothetical protein MKX03_033105 [Papaver bracteatum]|nr:hypothetical protein MKX03_033105 [Papaver bracteatum]
MVILRSHARREKERDRISELPEPLIHHIFSFLPIKCVVSTSILSKTWRYRWTSIPIIDFRERKCPSSSFCPKEAKAFIRFVDRVLSFRQDVHSPTIKKFCLSFDISIGKSLIDGWITTVLRKKIEELVLNDCRGSTLLPPGLFSCESLAILEISKSYFQLPESVFFPNLKILRLRVFLENEQVIQRLISNSPILEELSLKGFNWPIQHLRIFCPNLKRLFIDYVVDPNFDIQIYAPNLQSFKYSRVLAKDFVLPNFLTLLDAEVVLACPAGCRERGELGHLAMKLFSNLSYVKHLTVSDCSLKCLSYQDHFQTILPAFHNLIHLEVTSASLYFGFGCRDEGKLPCWVVGILLNFLHISPNLESLIFAEGFCRYASSNSNDWSLSLVPQCLLRSLKSIEFHGFWGKQVEKDLIRLFLKNAKVLQKVKITISGQSYLSMNSSYYQKKVLDEIALYPRGSAECVVHMS